MSQKHVVKLIPNKTRAQKDHQTLQNLYFESSSILNITFYKNCMYHSLL